MREIIFRGFHEDVNGKEKAFCNGEWHNGEWVYGDLLHDWQDKGDCIRQGAEYGKCGIYPIITSSVGQYSGLTDKHNRLVFERDIIKLVTADYEEITIVCEFGPVRRQIFENEVEITGFYFVRSNDGRKTFPITHNYLGKHDTEIWEVIGNRTENPELFTKND